MVKVVPAFAGFYETFDAQLPLPTRILTAVSHAIGSNRPLAGARARGGGHRGDDLAAFASESHPLARAWRCACRSSAPSPRKFATSQFARTLATLLGGGIPLVTALEVAGRAIGNRLHRLTNRDDDCSRFAKVRRWRRPWPPRRVFPDVALKMVEVGEATGALQEMLNAIADFFDEDIDTTLGRFMRLVEPVMLVVMAVVIAAILLALYLPVFQLSSAVG